MSRGFSRPSQEKVDEAIEKLANLIARRYHMETPALFALISMKPVAPIIRTTMFYTIFPYLPIFDALPGVEDFDMSTAKYLDILDKGENIDQLIRRIEEIAKEVREEENRGEVVEKKPNTLSFKRLKTWLRKL